MKKEETGVGEYFEFCGSSLAEATTFPSSRVERSTGPREEEGREEMVASRVSWLRQVREWTESPTWEGGGSWGGRRELGREEVDGEDLGQEGQGDGGGLPEGGEEAALLQPGLYCSTGPN